MPYSLKSFPPVEELQRIANEDAYYKMLMSEDGDFDGTTDRGKFLLSEFFENDKKKAELLSRAMHIAPLIVDVGTDFLFGEPYKVQAGNHQDDLIAFEERNKLQERMEESSRLFQGVGHAHFKIFKKNSKACVQEIPYSYYFPNWEGVPEGMDTEDVPLVTYLEKEKDNGEKVRYVFIENWYMKNEKAEVEYALFKEKPGNSGQIGERADFDEIGYKFPNAKAEEREDTATGRKSKVYIEKTDLDELPIVTVDHRKTVRERYGESIYKRVTPLLLELNDRLTQVSIQFVKHLNAKLQIPEGSVTVEKDGSVKVKDIEVLFARAGEAEAKYITNDNPLIEQAFTHIEKTLRAIAKLTKTPDAFLLEDEKGGVEKAESLKTRMMGFLKREKLYQRKYEAAIKKLYRLALKIEGKKDADTTQIIVNFDLGLPKDWQVDVEVWSAALEGGLASRRTAVARFQDLDEAETDEEIKRIEEEEIERAKSMAEEMVKAEGDDDGDEE